MIYRFRRGRLHSIFLICQGHNGFKPALIIQFRFKIDISLVDHLVYLVETTKSGYG